MMRAWTGLRRIGLAVAALGVLAGAAGPAGAGMINFTYAGTGVATATGSGSFTFADGLSTITLADLTAFSFSQSTNFGDPVVPTFTYGLGNLTAFAATVGPGSTLTSLSLTTGNVIGNPPTNAQGMHFQPQAFQVTSLATGAASTFNAIGGGPFTTGTAAQATPAAVPAPPTLTLAGLAGLIGLAYAGRRGPAGRRTAEPCGLPG
jgi:hypothetical protein